MQGIRFSNKQHTPEPSKMNTAIPDNVRLDSPKMHRILDHLHQARLARNELHVMGITVTQLAEDAKVGLSTARRFLGVEGEWNTKDPKTSTTRKIFNVLGYELVLQRKRSQ